MTPDERVRLLFGPYKAPLFEYGDLFCDMRGEVTIVGETEAKIPWPIGKTKRAKSLVIYAGLAEAIRGESNQAICYWWGVTPQTVTKWRKALGVPRETARSRELRRDYFDHPGRRQGQVKAWAKTKDPERNRKISEALKGRPKQPAQIASMNVAKRKKIHNRP